MANYSTIKNAINQYIRQNGNEEITGNVLNSVLNAMVSSLGADYQFAGIADPTTNPGTPDENVFYLAIQSGTYANFDGHVLQEGHIAAMLYDGNWDVQDKVISIADNIVTSYKIANNAVTTRHIQDGSIVHDLLANNAVEENNILNGSISTDKLQSGAVTTDKLEGGSVTSSKIGDEAVRSGGIANGAVTTSKIATGAVTTDKIATVAVTTDKIADGAIVHDLLADNAVEEDNILNGSVTTSKIANGSVTKAKLSQSVQDVLDKAERSIEVIEAVIDNDGGTTIADLSDIYDSDDMTLKKVPIAIRKTGSPDNNMVYDFESFKVQNGSVSEITFVNIAPSGVITHAVLTSNGWSVDFLKATNNVNVDDYLFNGAILPIGGCNYTMNDVPAIVRMTESPKDYAKEIYLYNNWPDNTRIALFRKPVGQSDYVYGEVFNSFEDADFPIQGKEVFADFIVPQATFYERKTYFDLATLKDAVAAGNLELYGLKPGDQTTINGHTYVIAGLNPMKGTSTPYRVNQNHVGLIVIPHTTHAWNVSGNTYEGADGRGAGYMNSDLHAYLKDTILPMCQSDLGSANLISHNKLLSSAVNTSGINRFGNAGGCSSSWAWEADCFISALSEMQVYGGTVWSSSGYDTGEACRQLEVFQKYSHTEIFGGEYPWLRDVASASDAAGAYRDGGAAYDSASAARYVAALILFK